MAEPVKKKPVKKNRSLWIPSLVAVIITIGAVMVWPEKTDVFLDPGHLLTQVASPMSKAMIFITVGLGVAMVIEALGWTVALGRLVAPLTSLARLPKAGTASFITSLVSTPAANAFLAEALDKKEIDPKTLFISNLMNGSWPTFIVHLPTTLVISTSFAGSAGLAYTALMFSAATLRLMGATLLGHLLLPALTEKRVEEAPPARKTLKEIWPGLRRRLVQRLIKLLSIAVPIYFLVTLAVDLGLFKVLSDFSTSNFPNFFLPAEAATLIVFSFVAEFSSGFVAAGALIDSLSLTVVEAAAALVVGNIIATPMRALRWQVPSILGFFQPGIGILLICFNQTFRVISLVLTLYVFWQIFGE